VNGNYYNGISFNKLADIYMFNARLRQILFPLPEENIILLRTNTISGDLIIEID